MSQAASILDAVRALPNYREFPGASHDFTTESWGVMLLNMGGPETTDDIKPYLYNLFCDRNIIQLPASFLLQKPLARFIAARRTPVVTERYRAIGGGSPQLKWTRLQAEGIRQNLGPRMQNLDVFIGMRYTPPSIAAELERAVRSGCRHLVILPLYPHYTLATTGTSLDVIREWMHKHAPEMTISLIPHWFNRPEYIALLRARIAAALTKIENRDTAKIIFTAHSLPVKLVESGDPYVDQVRETVRLAGKGYDAHLAYQSRSGPVKWLEPETVRTVEYFGRDGVTEIVMVPVSFVSDHIETLHEIDIEMAELARSFGIKRFVRTESFNDDPDFLRLLADMVTDKISLQGTEA